MCKCNPNIRTMWCGGVGCEAPDNFIPSSENQVQNRPGLYPEVTMEEFASMLASLPAEWAGIPRGEISLCEYRGKIILCSPHLAPIIYTDGKWEQMFFMDKKNGMAVAERDYFDAAEPPKIDPYRETRRAASRARVNKPIVADTHNYD